MEQHRKPEAEKQMTMFIEGHRVTVSFTRECNPNLSSLVRNTLLDAYIKKNEMLSAEGKPA